MNNPFQTCAALALALIAGAVAAQNNVPSVGTVAPWMSTEVGDAWGLGFKGQGVTITVVDDFKSNYGFYGNLSGNTQLLRHGEWTFKEAGMVAPLATMRLQDFTSGTTVRLNRGLNVLNLSYGMYAPAGFSASQIGWSAQERSIISYASKGSAIVSKAAGNDAVVIGGVNAAGNVDYLNLALKGAQAAIFVGALNSNGTTAAPASLASYSNLAGPDATVQQQFLVVGVEGSKTGLYGTSFAAPVVSAYGAILGSKFSRASAPQIANQLLTTARQDTIAGYNVAVHGRGEASITRALAPLSIR